MKIAWITGAYGFVGPYLARELSRRGRRVYAIDRPEKSAPEQMDVDPLVVELSDPDQVALRIAETRPDEIFHLAAQSSAALSFDEPALTLQQNLMGTVGLLEGIRRAGEANGAPQLLSVGSCEEYGPIRKESDLPVTEDQALNPASPYAVSKAAQTLLCLQYHQAYDLPIVCTRSFTHTGAGQSSRFVFSSFAKQIAELEASGASKGTLKVGNLAAVRDVSDVGDVTTAYCELLEKGEPGRAYNVCSGRGLEIEQGLRSMLQRSTVEIEVEVDPARLRPLDVPRFVGDPSRLEAAIGWKPSRPAEETLAELLEYWRCELGGTGQQA